MSSLVGTRRGHAASSASASNGLGSGGVRTSAARASRPSATASSDARGSSSAGRPSSSPPSRAVRRAPSAHEPSHTLPTEVQRNRLLSAAIRSLDECGYANTSVAQITSRARISRRTFYELFATREECLLAVFDDAIAQVERELVDGRLGELPWRERVRLGLWTILSFFEREPARARVCVVHSLQGDVRLLARREALLARLAAILDEGRTLKGTSAESAPAQATPVTAEGLVGAALSILYTRLSRGEREPLTELAGELMGLFVLPYLGGAAAKRERTRPTPEPLSGPRKRPDERFVEDPLAGISMRLTYRTMRVLECLAAEPNASNRRLGTLAGVPDQGQMSKLLARLERLGLLVNAREAGAKGEANVWHLTAQGLQVTQTIGLGIRSA